MALKMKQPEIKPGLQMAKYHCRPISCSRHTIGMFTVGATECRSTQTLAFLQMFYTSNYSKMKKRTTLNYLEILHKPSGCSDTYTFQSQKEAGLGKLGVCVMKQHVRHGLALAQHGDK